MTNLPAPGTPPHKANKSLLGKVTGAVTGRVVETVDPDIILEYVDVDALIRRIDVDALLDRIDVDRLLGRIDLNTLLEKVDLNTLLEGVDLNTLLGKVDLNTLLEGVDLNAVLVGVDLEGIVRRSGIPDLVAESTGAMAGSALDVARRQIVGLDVMINRVVDRMMRRTPQDRVLAPPLLRADRTDDAMDDAIEDGMDDGTGQVTP